MCIGGGVIGRWRGGGQSVVTSVTAARASSSVTPTLRRRIRLGASATLDQRVALRYSMDGMDGPETASYVAHRLKIAGRSDTLFSDDALTLVNQVSREGATVHEEHAEARAYPQELL